jgi:hypothetical protein
MLLLLWASAWAQDDDSSGEDDSAGEVVVVTGTRTEESLSDTIVTTDVVTREEVEESGASDASEVLETIPGVQVTRSFRGAGVRMQGLDPKYTLILVDGERVIGQTDGVVDLSRIPAERIERIEIVKACRTGVATRSMRASRSVCSASHGPETCRSGTTARTATTGTRTICRPMGMRSRKQMSVAASGWISRRTSTSTSTRATGAPMRAAWIRLARRRSIVGT